MNYKMIIKAKLLIHLADIKAIITNIWDHFKVQRQLLKIQNNTEKETGMTKYVLTEYQE